LLPTTSAAASEDKCASQNALYCPNCGGYEVSDCLDCDGYLNTDSQHDICFDRQLFAQRNTDKDDPDNHYHYLWRDLLGMVVWFCAAGVATACGVGGGGIYVPLGIILLNFSPKPASGLSQASIFGASLGGLLLNIRNKHPNEKIRDNHTIHPESGRVSVIIDVDMELDFDSSTLNHTHNNPQEQQLSPQAQEQQLSPQARKERQYTSNGGKFYTRPLIDYDMALFLAPMEMAGAVLGVLIQKILPNWLYLGLAAIILAFTSYKTYNKYFSTRAAEKVEQAEAEEAEAAQEQPQEQAGRDTNAPPEQAGTPVVNDPEQPAKSTPEYKAQDTQETLPTSDSETADVDDPLRQRQGEGAPPLPTTDDDNQDTTNNKSTLQEYLEHDARQYPTEKLAALGVLWVGLILLTFFKGGKGVDSIVGITCADAWYVVLIAIQFLWTLGFALWFGLKLVKHQKEKVAVDYPFLPNDVLWDYSKLRFYAFFTFLAGVVAGLIGIGGGMVLGPLMLVMGIHPRVSAATTATMIVLTSSSVAVLFVTAGLVPWEYAVFFFFTCLTGAYVGKKYIDGYVKRTGKASLLIFLLATIIALATVGCVIIVISRLAKADWCLAGFNDFCNLSEDDEDMCPANRLLGFVVDR
jgi:uncharacterized membrane protein YfcA